MKYSKQFLPFLIHVICLPSCLKKDYERPPDQRFADPKLPVTHTIGALKAMNGPYDFRTGGDTTLILQDVVVSGLVTADDRSGNFYKRIVVEDSTGGLVVLLDGYNLYHEYPVGRKLYLRCRGLTLGYDGGLPVLGAAPTAQLVPAYLPAGQMEDHVVKGPAGNTHIPVSRSLIQVAEADPALYNRLVLVSDVEFADTLLAYTQPNATTNRELSGCAGGKLAIRSSNYASFAGCRLPAGRGDIAGIYTVYTSSVSGARTPQLVIRDTHDVRMSGPRCAGAPGAAPLAGIDSIRRLAHDDGSVVLHRYRIHGQVISDRQQKHIDSRNLVLQDGFSGIIVRFSAGHSFNLGDSLIIDISGTQLGRYNGALQVGALNTGSVFRPQQAVRVATGRKPGVRLLTIADMVQGPADSYESTLVCLKAVRIAAGVYAGNKSLTDASDMSGSLKLFTASGAVFARDPTPSGEVNITGIAGVFGSTRQISIRSPTDIQ